MKKIGLWYAENTTNTASVARKIEDAFGKDAIIEKISIEKIWDEDFNDYANLIVGTSTWFDGELPLYWDEAKYKLEALNLKGKKVAIFGLGDQVKYPENFVDGIGTFAELLKASGAELVGLTSTEGYVFEHSKGVRNGKFAGLVIDVENQSDLTDQRIHSWVKQLKKEFI